MGIFVNCYLISQLELVGIALLLGYLAAAALFYFSYGMHHSVGANGGWDEYVITPIALNNNSDDEQTGDGEKARLTSWAEPPPLFNQTKQRKSLDKNLVDIPQFA